ncbi:MAG: pyridoxal-phosphate-dependent aminotransferase family protein [Gemmatimonadaceae bacterium]
MTIPAFGTFFLPGPTEVRAEVLQAMTRPMISHRGSEFERLFDRVQVGLQAVFSTSRPVFIGTCSATGFMEAGVRCAPPGRVLALVNGAFSERFARIAAACGRAVDSFIVADGEVHDPAEVGKRLGAAHYSTVAVVHSETSTGALNDVRAISDVAHRNGAVCLIDSVTGAGGTEIRFDEWAMDYVLTGSQKALALPPGLAFGAASEQFMRQAAGSGTEDRGVYFDLGEFEAYARKHQVPNTPALSLFYALDTQLTAILAEGIEARWARHTAMAERTARWVTEMRDGSGIDLSVLAAEGHRSPTVTTVMLPNSLASNAVVRAVAERGFTIGAGYGKLKESTVRVGHMGDHTLETLENCLAACSDALGALI